MATRIFCDHCGLKIPSATKFYFGKYNVEATYAVQTSGIGQYQQAAGLSAQGIAPGYGGAANYPVAPSKPAERHYATVVVDLCDVCVPIWYERANNLCKANKD